MLTVGQLKELLEGVDDDAEVRLAFQPSWPFEYSLDAERSQVVDLNGPDEDGMVVTGYTSDGGTIREEPEEGVEYEDVEPHNVFYLVEGQQLDYLPGIVREAIGW